jgi:hypothetical protein
MAKSKKSKSSKPSSAEANRQREEARRRAAAERRARAEAEQRRKEFIGRARKLILPALGVIAVFTLSIVIIRPSPEVRAVTRTEEVEGQALAVGQTFDYGTPTPTSGPYAAGTPACGVFSAPVATEEAVAAMRVGAVVLWYSDPELAPQLAEYASRFDSHVLVSPNDAIDDPIVATAWLRLKAYDDIDLLLDDDFADIYRLQRGEEGDCPMTGG